MRTGTNCVHYSLLWTRVNAVVRVCEDAYWSNLLAILFTVNWRKHGSKSV